MPRTPLSEEIATPTTPKKRAPRKRATAAAEVDEVATPRPRAKRTRSKEVAAPPVAAATEPVVSEDTGRRAPTPLAENRQNNKRSARAMWAALIAGVMLIGTGIGIGLSDTGQIDVVAVVTQRNEKINRGEVREGDSTILVPVQNTDQRPNGGMVPADIQPQPAEVVTASSSEVITASSTTETTATSTEALEVTSEEPPIITESVSEVS